ncbi:hypothetical protein IJ579_01945 [bacterium]|nr:hypothetical protein [bacterium]
MKKISLILLFLFFVAPFSAAEDVVALEFDDNYKQHTLNITRYEDEQPQDVESELPEEAAIVVPSTDNISTPMTLQSGVFAGIKNAAEGIYKLPTDNLNSVTPLLSEQMTKHYESGPFESTHLWGVVQNTFDNMIPEGGNSYSKYDVNLINIFLDTKTRDGKDLYRIMVSPTHSHSRSFMQNLFQDLYYETKRVPHHSILVGNSRVGIGIEGTQSAFTLPLLNRSQISRNFSNVRKRGLRIRGDYKYVDYDFGGYSSDTFFTEFLPGMEFNGWVNFKPLANTNEKYGKISVGNGISAGKRDSIGYFVYGAGLQYDYKKFRAKVEYAIADGSNGATGLSNKRREGWDVLASYRLTKKLELLARYDEFNPDKSKHSHNRREYTAGINYYLKGQSLKLMLNYIFCQNEFRKNSHRILLGFQLAL